MITEQNPAGLPRASRALDALNFFLADVRTGLGPYLAIYLLTVRNWNEAEIGIVMSISAIAGILAETPAGALIDTIRAKRDVVVLAALAVTAGSLLLPFLSTFLAVAAFASGRECRRFGIRSGDRGDLARHRRSCALCPPHRPQ